MLEQSLGKNLDIYLDGFKQTDERRDGQLKQFIITAT